MNYDPYLKRTHIRSVSSMNSHMSSQVKIKRKSFSTALKCALKKKKNIYKNLDYLVTIPGKASLQCVPAGVSLVYWTLQMPSHTLRIHGPWARECASASSWRSCPWTSWYSPCEGRQWSWIPPHTSPSLAWSWLLGNVNVKNHPILDNMYILPCKVC